MLIHIKSEFETYLKRLVNASDKKRVYAMFADALKDTQKYLLEKVKSEYLSGQVLNRVSGKLSRSIKAAPIVVNEKGAITANVGSYKCEYAAIHEFGGMQRRYGKHKGNYLVKYRERSYLRRALKDKQDKINQYLEKKLIKIMREVISANERT